MGLLDFFSKLDPTKVKKADTSGVDAASGALNTNAAAAGAAATDMKNNPVTATHVSIADPGSASQTSRQAPIVANTVRGTTQQVASGGNASFTRMNAAQVSPVNNMSAADVAQVNSMQAGQIAPVINAAGAQVSPIERMQAAAINRTDEDFRAQQANLANSLTAQANGQGPTLAQAQLQKANEQAIQAQAALAASSRGGNPVLAQRQAAQNIANIQQNNAASSAQLAMQEQMAARQQLGDALSQARGQDIGVNSTQAQLNQASEQFNSGAANTAGLTQAQLSQDNSQFNAGSANSRGLAQGQLDQGANQFNSNAANTRDLTNAGFAQDASQFNTGAANSRDLAQANFIQDANKTNTTLDQDTSKFNAGQELTRDMFNSEQDFKAAQADQAAKLTADQSTALNNINTDQFNAKAKDEMARFTTDAKLRADTANQAADLTARGMTLDQIAKYMGLEQDSLSAVLNAEQTKLGVEQGRNNQSAGARSGLVTGILGGAASGGSSAIATAAMSDRNSKENIQPIGKMEDFLNKLEPYSYDYKDPSAKGAAPGKRFGVMAQDLSKSDIGKSIVNKDQETGMLMIDTNQAIGVLFASIADMNKRMKGEK